MTYFSNPHLNFQQGNSTSLIGMFLTIRYRLPPRQSKVIERMRERKINLVLLSSILVLVSCMVSIQRASGSFLTSDFDITQMAVYPINKAPEVNYLNFSCTSNLLEIDNTTKVSVYNPNDYLQLGLNISLRQYNTSTWGGIRFYQLTLLGFSLDEGANANLGSPDYILLATTDGNPGFGGLGPRLFVNGSSIYYLFNFSVMFTSRNGTNDFRFHESRLTEWVRWFVFIQFDFLEADTGNGAGPNVYSSGSIYRGSMMSAQPVFQLNTTFSYASPPGSNNPPPTPDTPWLNYAIVGGLSAAIAAIVVGVIVRKRL